jgi:membrane protein DedA with SNARE-associated domain
VFGKEAILRVVDTFQAHPYSLVFLGLLSCGLGVPVPEEFFLVTSGYVCYRNGIPDVAGLVPMFIVTWLAIAGGDLLAFGVGRRFGNAVFETRPMKRLVSASGRAKAEEFLRRYGSKTIMAARFLPGIRMPTYLLCGTLGVPLATFMLFDGTAMAVSVPIQVYLSWRYGRVLDDALARIARLNQTLLIGAIVMVLFIYVKVHSGGGLKNLIPAGSGAADPPPAPGPEPAGAGSASGQRPDGPGAP